MEIHFKGSVDEFKAVMQSLGSRAEAVFEQSIQELVNADTIKIEHNPPLSLVPDQEPAPDWTSGPVMPKDDDPFNRPAARPLPKISQEVRDAAWKAFVEFCSTWTKGFGQGLDVPQPDRLDMMQKLGSGRFTMPVLIMAYEIGSLQRMVQRALEQADGEKIEDIDWVDQVAANMVQVSHMGFPDLAGTYDYSTKWRRA